jgi:hypothetical protein
LPLIRNFHGVVKNKLIQCLIARGPYREEVVYLKTQFGQLWETCIQDDIFMQSKIHQKRAKQTGSQNFPFLLGFLRSSRREIWHCYQDNGSTISVRGWVVSCKKDKFIKFLSELEPTLMKTYTPGSQTGSCQYF